MARFSYDTVRLDITFDRPGGDVARSLTARNQQLTIDTPGADGFFNYRIIGREAGALPEIELRSASFASSDLRVGGIVVPDEAEAEIGVIDFAGGSATILVLSVVDGADEILAVTRLAGDDLPTITTAAQFNNLVNSSSFSPVSSGPFRPGVDIPLSSVQADDDDPIDVPFVFGTGAADMFDGDAGDDAFNGGGGADTISGGGGADTLFGAGGKDEISGGGGRDSIEGGGGKDKLIGGGGGDDISGGGGRDFLDGKGGADMLSGGNGKDTLIGGGGKDTLEGGKANDILTGGGGRDFFAFRNGDGRDRITDYRDGQDKFQIGAGADDFGDLTIRQVGDNALVRFGNVRITVEDTDAGQLGAGDFIFT